MNGFLPFSADISYERMIIMSKLGERISNAYHEANAQLNAKMAEAAQGKAGAIANVAIRAGQTALDAYGAISDADTAAASAALNSAAIQLDLLRGNIAEAQQALAESEREAMFEGNPYMDGVNLYNDFDALHEAISDIPTTVSVDGPIVTLDAGRGTEVTVTRGGMFQDVDTDAAIEAAMEQDALAAQSDLANEISTDGEGSSVGMDQWMERAEMASDAESAFVQEGTSAMMDYSQEAADAYGGFIDSYVDAVSAFESDDMDGADIGAADMSAGAEAD